MPRLIDTRTTPLVKASLLLYYPQVIKPLYGRTVLLAVNTIVSILGITAGQTTSAVRIVTSSERPLRYTKRTTAGVFRQPKRSFLAIQIILKSKQQLLRMLSTLVQILQRLQNTTLSRILLLILATRIDYQRLKRQLRKPTFLEQLKRSILLHSISFLPGSYIYISKKKYYS